MNESEIAAAQAFTDDVQDVAMGGAHKINGIVIQVAIHWAGDGPGVAVGIGTAPMMPLALRSLFPHPLDAVKMAIFALQSAEATWEGQAQEAEEAPRGPLQ